jgi:hypothetical protein
LPGPLLDTAGLPAGLFLTGMAPSITTAGVFGVGLSGLSLIGFLAVPGRNT